MDLYVLTFLMGVILGLRTFTGLAAICWAAHLRWLHLENTPLDFLGFVVTPYITTALAIGELVGDKLPKTPSRTEPLGLTARIISGSLCGAAIGASRGSLWAGLIAGALGALAGTFGGALVRAALAKAFSKDLPAAALEDLVAIGAAFFIVTR